MASAPPSTWSVWEVVVWLRTLELAQYAARFEELRVDGTLLFEITDEDLARDLGVSIRLHRVKLLEAIRRLREDVVSNCTPFPHCSQISSQSTESDLSIQDSDLPAQYRSVGLYQRPRVLDSNCNVLLLKALDGVLLGQCFILGPAGVVLGRQSTTSGVVIQESSVSRSHCKVHYSAKTNQFLLEDLGSTTGTFLLLRRPIPLRIGQLFQAGCSEFRVCNIRYSSSGVMLELELVMYEGPPQPLLVTVKTQGLLIGREVGEGFSVEADAQMSAAHLQIFHQDDRFWLADCQSTNGTWLRLSPEGEHSDLHPVVHGDVFKMGASVFAVQSVNSALSALCSCGLNLIDTTLLPCGHFSCSSCSRQTCGECGCTVQTRVPLQ